MDENISPNYTHLQEAKNMGNPADPALNSSSHIEFGSGQPVAPEVLPDSLPNDRYVYRQDVVRCSKHEGLLGVVMEVAGDSDSEGSISDDSDIVDDADENNVSDGADGNGGHSNVEMDDENRNDDLPEGQVRIVWTDGSESTNSINDVMVVDRGFLHGDVVASVSDQTGQLGLVVDVSISVDLQAFDGGLMKNVSSKDLKRIREFTIGDHVVLGPWLGRVDDVLDNVTVSFDDGSVCKVVKADPLKLKPVSRPIMDDANCPYYPGQRVRAVSSSVFKNSRWLSGLWKANRLEGTVIKVQTASVIIYWIASAYLGAGTTSNVPSEEQNPKDLKLLSCFSYANWQLGDWCLPPSSYLDKACEVDNLHESMEECDSGALLCKRFLVDKSFDNDSMPRTSHAGESLGVSKFVRGLQSLERENSVVDESNINTSTIVCDAKGELVAEHTIHGYNENSLTSVLEDSNLISQDCDSMKQDTRIGENNATEFNYVMPVCGSHSSMASVLKEPGHEGWSAYRKKLRKVLFKREKKARRKDENFERALLIVSTVTKVDVAWQDGSREYGLESTSLIPIRTPSDHEFFPEQYVVEKASNEVDGSVETTPVGIVRSVNSKERTVCVRWFKPVSTPEDPRQHSYDEVVSAYEVEEHPDYDYCYGDVVVRLSPVSCSADATAQLECPLEKQGQTAVATELESDANGAPAENDDTKSSNYDPRLNYKFLSWVGNITGLQDGDIEVAWADGMVSKVGPQAVYVVGREDDAESYEGGTEISDGASWETVDEYDMGIIENPEQEAVWQGANTNILGSGNNENRENTENNPSEGIAPGKTTAISVSLAAISFVTRLATGLFSRNRRHSDLSNSNHSGPNDSDTERILGDSVNGKTDGYFGASDHQDVAMIVDDRGVTADEVDSSASSGGDADSGMCCFKHFDITESPADHYFLSSTGQQGSAAKKWIKKVQQEWSILEKNLPDDIYVRVYEDRMDLLRAVIVGACGTPYQDGLFFFDFLLPPEYPQVPPVAYYHSGGLRVNPNLYVDGKVCLSLLNTWTGRGNEVWEPSSSSILQVLVSLQGLVLNSKPYFNEAGYEKQVGTVEGEKNSIPYNENTYLLNLKSMIYLMRRPPTHFEGFVKDHFRRHGCFILKACEAYMSGFLIATLTDDARITEKSKEYPSSVGFKLMLAKILPRLIAALSEVGVDCQNFEHLIKKENHQ
ncbi:putative ubiquitin-conjugating enzyme E2 23 [Apostasia shenzhenica]|uniref:E2 ubiquitin-conjugating enzyme n=1 Tax=Apostasia shenzhenica TaxID=1088818 RepID=A0A2I0AJE9_9ASPA|nr:putative ubiquitin-conjugating enzyme E2 23 [Apostasia shenzhenica]